MRGQITIFLLLGVVILVLIALIYLVRTVSPAAEVDSSLTRQVRQLIDDCVESVTLDGISTLLKQGGVIYVSQGGTYEDPDPQNAGVDHILYANDKIRVGIARNTISTAGVFAADPPDYPWVTFPYPDQFSAQELFEGFYSRLLLTPLKAVEGPNSWEAQLTEYLQNNLEACTDYSRLRGVTATSEPPEVAVILAPERLTVDVYYPTVIESLTSKKRAEVNEFSFQESLAMGRFFSFVTGILQQDAFDISFDVSAADANGFEVDVLFEASPNVDIIEVRDTQQSLVGKDILFRTARQNRPPALRFVRPAQLTAPHTLTSSDMLLEAFDPDEDPVQISVSPPLPLSIQSPTTQQLIITASDGQYTDSQTVAVVIS